MNHERAYHKSYHIKAFFLVVDGKCANKVVFQLKYTYTIYFGRPEAARVKYILPMIEALFVVN